MTRETPPLLLNVMQRLNGTVILVRKLSDVSVSVTAMY